MAVSFTLSSEKYKEVDELGMKLFLSDIEDIVVEGTREGGDVITRLDCVSPVPFVENTTVDGTNDTESISDMVDADVDIIVGDTDSNVWYVSGEDGDEDSR